MRQDIHPLPGFCHSPQTLYPSDNHGFFCQIRRFRRHDIPASCYGRQQCSWIPAQSDGTLALSSIHRWITTIGRFIQTCRTALILLLQENPVSSICRDLARLKVPQRKYKTDQRKRQLIGCRQLVIIEDLFQATFKTSIFTKLATHCGFS